MPLYEKGIDEITRSVVCTCQSVYSYGSIWIDYKDTIMKKCLKAFTFLVAVAFVAFSVPFLGLMPAATGVVASSISDFHHAPHNQTSARFETRPVTFANGNFQDTAANPFTSGTVHGWSQETSVGNALSGTLNMAGFSQFRASHAPLSPSFLSVQPAGIHDNVLVMSNTTNEATSRIGWYSEEIYFQADSNYVVSVDFYAVQSQSEIFLMPVSADEHMEDLVASRGNSIDIRQRSIQGQPNTSAWQTARFYIRTDARESIAMQLGLYLGTREASSRGVVFYNNVTVMQYSDQNFAVANTGYNHVIDLRRDQSRQDAFGVTYASPDISVNYGAHEFRPLTSGVLPSGTYARTMYNTAIPGLLNFEEVTTLHTFDSRIVRNDVLLLSAINNSIGMETTSTFNVRRNEVYMISFYALHVTGNAHVRIFDPADDDGFDSGFLSINGSGGSAWRNMWALNTIFVQGNALYDTAVSIELWMGTDESNTTGWVAIDGFSIARVNHEYQTRHQESTAAHNVTMIDLLPSPSITNSGFNLGTVSNVAAPFPLRANDWNLEYENEESIISGIVNTQGQHWSRFASNYGRATNPGAIDGLSPNNNVFMMQNVGSTWQVLSTETFTLTPSTTTMISFDVARVYESSHGMHFWAIIESEGREIARINMSPRPRTGTNRQVTTGWQNYSFGIRTGSGTTNIQVAFVLGTEARPTNSGIVFLDNVDVTPAGNQTTGFDTFVNVANTVHLAGPNGQSLAFVSDDPTGIQARVDFNPTLGHEVLSIQTTGFTEARIWDTMPGRFEEENWYEFQVRLRITLFRNVVGGTIQYFERKDLGYDDDGDRIFEPDDADYGVNIGLENFDGGFFNMRDEHLRAMPDAVDGFATLSFFVNAETSIPAALSFSFANDYRKVNAQIVIASTEIRRIQQSEFDDIVELLREDPDNRQFAIISESDPFEDNDGDDNEPRDPWDWDFLIIPSIIMAVALIVALVGYTIRKVKFKKHISKDSSSYARDDAGITEDEIVNLKSKRAPKEPKTKK